MLVQQVVRRALGAGCAEDGLVESGDLGNEPVGFVDLGSEIGCSGGFSMIPSVGNAANLSSECVELAQDTGTRRCARRIERKFLETAPEGTQ